MWRLTVSIMYTGARPASSVTIDFDLVPGRLVKRLNRFMALAEVDCGEVHAHLPNSGRLSTAFYPGDSAYLRRHESRLRRKSAYSVFAVQHDGIAIIVDAQFSNLLARRAIERGLLSGLDGYVIAKENFKVSSGVGSKLDFMLERGSSRFFIEVKSVTHAVDGIALFPDAPTMRGRLHLRQLMRLLTLGFGAGIIFSVQRPDANLVKPNEGVDPEFAALLREAMFRGMKVFTLKSAFQPPKTVKLEPNEPRFQL